MKPSLVTGGCGFVGRHVVMRLLGMGRRVWAVDDLSTGLHPDTWLPNDYANSGEFEFVHDDVRRFFARCLDPSEPAGQMPPFEDVFHFAAVVGGRLKIDNDPIAVATDLAIDSAMFNWAVRARPGRVLYASSSAAYPIDLQGTDNAVALKESDIDFGGRLGQPDMTYGWSKLTGEYLARIAAQHYGLSVACVRPFSGYGEDQDPSYPVPAIAARAARREDPFDVWGDGHQGRDFVHIEDCVDAMLLALERISDGSAVNIGSGRLTSFRDVIHILCGFAGYEPTIKPLMDKPVGVRSRYADTTLAKALLGFEPRITIEEGLSRVYDAAVCRSVSDT